MSAIRIMLDRLDPRGQSWHPKFISNFAKQVGVSNYLEVGVYQCETLRLVAKSADRVVGIDIDSKALESAPRRSNVTTFLGTAQDYLSLQGSERFDLIFIDANHSKASVIEDFEAVQSMLMAGGTIMLHDTWPKTREFSSPMFCGDAFLAVHELRKRRPDFSFFTIPSHPGLTLCQRTDIFPPWFDSHLGV